MTMNKNNRKELLYRETFKLFLQRQFNGVSLHDIEEATQMTRGAIFYYHNSKLELFIGVVKHYFIEKQKVQTTIPYLGIPFENFLGKYVDAIELQMNNLKKAIGDICPTSASKAYIILGLKLREYSEALNNEYTEIRNKILANWVAAIQNAIVTGEIDGKTDAMVMAEIFVNVYLGQSIWDSFQSGLDITRLRYKFHYIYNLIKSEVKEPIC